MFDLCLESIIFLEKVKQEIIILSHIISLFPKKKVAPSDKVTPSEEVEKGTNLLDDMYNMKFTEKLDLPMRIDSVTPKTIKGMIRIMK